MPNHKRSHSENRRNVCFIWFKKPKNQLRNISEAFKLLINNHLICDASNNLNEESLSWLPTVICTSCCKSLKVFDCDSSKPLKHIDYSCLTPPQELRAETVTRSSKDSDCTCSVCSVAQMKNEGNKYQNYKKQIFDLRGCPSTQVLRKCSKL